MDSKQVAVISANPTAEIHWLIKIPCETLDVPNAGVKTLLSRVATRRIWLAVQRDRTSPQAMAKGIILSKLRATYADRNVDFYVRSDRATRVLIGVSLSSATTRSERAVWEAG